MSTASPQENPSTPAGDSSYPEQRHAGKVGYGPNFSKKASVVDRLAGFTEEIHGKIAHNPDLVKEGHDKHTGEAQRRKALGLDEKDSPFGNAQDENKDGAQSPSSATSGKPKSDKGEKASSSATSGKPDKGAQSPSLANSQKPKSDILDGQGDGKAQSHSSEASGEQLQLDTQNRQDDKRARASAPGTSGKERTDNSGVLDKTGARSPVSEVSGERKSGMEKDASGIGRDPKTANDQGIMAAKGHPVN